MIADNHLLVEISDAKLFRWLLTNEIVARKITETRRGTFDLTQLPSHDKFCLASLSYSYS